MPIETIATTSQLIPTTDKEISTILFDQGPYFVLLLIVGYGFYKFLERTYEDHKEQMKSLQETFKSSIETITNNIGGRLDKIEDTLERYNNK